MLLFRVILGHPAQAGRGPADPRTVLAAAVEKKRLNAESPEDEEKRRALVKKSGGKRSIMGCARVSHCDERMRGHRLKGPLSSLVSAHLEVSSGASWIMTGASSGITHTTPRPSK
jgi:hypothetical protein